MGWKNYYLLVISVFISVILFSCKKEYQTDESETDIENLNIPAGFDWETSLYTNFEIVSEQATVITIRSAENQTVYHQGFYNHLEDYYRIALRIPAYETAVFVNDQLVSLQSNTLSVNLSEPQNKATLFANEFPEGLLAWWRFDETEGNIATDETENFDGTLNGATRATGINGSALYFAGDGSNVRIDNSPELDLTGDEISFSVWFARDDLEASGTFFFINTKVIFRMSSTGKISLNIYNPTFTSIVTDWSDRVIDQDWHHLVGVYNGSQMHLYLDGVLLKSNATSGNLNSSSADLLLGSQSSVNFFSGQLDEAMIFDRALTVEDVAYLYANNYNPSDGNNALISHWPLDVLNGNQIAEVNGGFNATATDLTPASGMVGNCMDFNGSTSTAIAPHHPDLNPGEAFTMMAWVNTRENKTTKIVQKGDWDGHGIGQGKWDGWNAHVRSADQITHQVKWDEGLPIFGEWYHLTMTYDGSALKLFVNGQFKGANVINKALNVNTRTFSIGSDNGSQKHFNGLIDEVKYFNTALSAIEIQTAMAATGNLNDTDGDGIPDEEDDFPDDPARAFVNHFPAAGFGSLAFEDLWPGKGDYDFNDLVVDYQFNMITNQSNKLTEVEAIFAVRANGAGLRNGFGFQLPGTISDADYEVSGYQLEENYIVLNENGTESGQTIPTIIVFDNIKNILQSNEGFGANVIPGLPYIEPDTIKIIILIKPNTYSLSDFQPENFNPFLIVDMERGKEIHLPDYPPTALADATYFGQVDDDSDSAMGRYYKTETQLPWAINIIESFDYTIEQAQIIQGHLMFAPWAESGGTLYPDWYQNKNGYRSTAHIYVVP
jgi:LruC domain-containing protein